MNAFGVFKKATELVVSLGVGAVVGNAIKATTPADMSRLKKISVGIGSVVIGSLMSELAAKKTVEQIDDIVAEYKKQSQDDIVEVPRMSDEELADLRTKLQNPEN